MERARKDWRKLCRAAGLTTKDMNAAAAALRREPRSSHWLYHKYGATYLELVSWCKRAGHDVRSGKGMDDHGGRWFFWVEPSRKSKVHAKVKAEHSIHNAKPILA